MLCDFNTFCTEEVLDPSDQAILSDYMNIYNECHSYKYKLYDKDNIRIFCEGKKNFFVYIVEGLKKLFDMIKRFFKRILVRFTKDKRSYETELTKLKSTIDSCSKYTFTDKATITIRDLDYEIIGGTTKYDGIVKGIINNSSAIMYTEYDDLTVGNVMAISTDIMENINTYSLDKVKGKLNIINGALKEMSKFHSSDAWSIFIYRQTVSRENARKLDITKSVSDNITNLHGTKRITLRGNEIVNSKVAKTIHDSIMNFDISAMIRVLDDGESFFNNFASKFDEIVKKLSRDIKHTMNEDEYTEKFNFANIYSNVFTTFIGTVTQVFNTSKIELDNYFDIISEYCDELSRCKDQYGSIKEE